VKIKFFAVGGTIDKVYFDKLSEYQIGPPSVQSILDGLPLAFSYEVESLMRKDSLDMDDTDRELVLERIGNESCAKIIVTHGTDTMVQTARVLRNIQGKVIVLTGAMEPSSFKSSDAVFNLGFAIGAVSSLGEGVYIAMNGKVFDSEHCRKNREKGSFEEIIPVEINNKEVPG
jgi:L-asparaginase